MQHIVYLTHEMLYGSRSTRDELLNELRPLALAPLLKLLAALNDHLRSEENRPSMSAQQELLPLFYSRSELQVMADIDRSSRPVVVHRQQLLFLLKEALFVCPDSGLDVSTDFRLLGKALLRANDLLAHVFPKATTLAERALVAAAHFFGIQEAGVFHSYEYKMLRSFWMLQKTLPSLFGFQPFFDIPRLFTEQTRLNLIDFQVLQFMTMTSFIKEVARTRPTSPIDLPETWFRTTNFSSDVINDYLKYVSATVNGLRERVQRQRDPSDFTAFRDTPLLRLDGRLILLDFYFLCEKAESGPFWAARCQIPEAESNVYFSFWGNLFERYIADVLTAGADPKINRVIPDPRFADGDQFADCVVICGDAMLMIEAKTSTISARAKYGADLGYLERTLRRNFVENGTSPKAVRQLVNGIARFFRDGARVNDLKAARINRVFPIIITRDEVGATVGVNLFLNEAFRELMQAQNLKIPQSVTPLICLSAEDLERFSPQGKQVRFDKILEAYFKGYRRDNAKLKPFMLTLNTLLQSQRKDDTPDAFKDVAHEIGCLTEQHMQAGLEST